MNVTPFNFKMPLIFLFGVFILTHCKECASTKTVVLIYDKVNVTAYDIEWLTRHVVQLSTACLNKSLDVEFILKFPDESNIHTTSNRITSRNDYSIEGQSTLKTLLKHIRESPSYSEIYVITNVTKPSDETPLHEIFEAIQIKRTEVNFLVGAICPGYDYETYRRMLIDAMNVKKYNVISAVSNGDVMGPYLFTSDLDESRRKNSNPEDGHPPSVGKFTDLINLELIRIPAVIWYQQVVHKDNKTYCTRGPQKSFFENENSTASSLQMWMIKDEGEYNRRRNGNFESGIMELKMEMTPATHTSEICDEINEEYRKAGRPDLMTKNRDCFSTESLYTDKDACNFHYGFTVKEVRSLNETYRRPIKGMSNKIYVSAPIDKHNSYEFSYCNIIILLTDYIQLGEKIALKRVNETDLYEGSFYPPNEEYFFIQAVVQREDKTIARRSSTALAVAQGFGDDYGNPMFNQEPTFKNPPEPEDNPSAYYIDGIFDGIIGYVFVGFIGYCFGYVLGSLRGARRQNMVQQD